MFDFNDMKATIPSRDLFKYWFKREGNDWRIEGYTEDSGMVYICNYSQLDEQPVGVVDEITAEFERFKETRPEYYFGAPVDVDADRTEQSIINNAKTFDMMYAGAMLVKADTDDAIPTIEKCLRWLHGTDFYTSPASVRYHDSFAGGLVYHSLLTANNVYDLLDTKAFSMVNMCEAIIVALVHDWCKIYLYELYMRNVKDEQTKKWHEVPEYRYRDASTVPSDFLSCREQGHGAGSTEIARAFMKLTSGMRLAIRWHMGRWNVADSEINSLQWANENEPLVHLIQFADQLATTNY